MIGFVPGTCMTMGCVEMGGGVECGVGGGGGERNNTEGEQTTKKWEADEHAKR